MRILTAFLVVVVLGDAVSPARAAGPPFSVEFVDESLPTPHLIPGRLVRTPAGALVATGAIPPGNPSWYVDGTPYASFTRERTASGWIERASQPPIDIAFGHDVAIDDAGRMHTMSWQNPCSDYSRPVLQEEDGSGGWVTTVLDTGVTTGVGIRLDSRNEVWVAFLRAHRINCCWGTPFDLVIAHRGTNGWERDSLVVQSSTVYTPYPLAIDASGRPHVLFLDSQGLWHAVRDGSGWHFSNVDAGPVLGTPRLELAWDGTPHVLYSVGSTLWHGRLDGASWVRSPLPLAMMGSVYDLALAQNGSPRAAYVGSAGKLAYAQDAGTGWTSSEVGMYTYANPAHEVTLVLDPSDRPSISFRGGGSSTVEIASVSGSTGVTATLGGASLALALASTNPARAGAAVSWSVQLPIAGSVTLEAFDVSGRRLATSSPWECVQGENRLEWDPAPQKAGTFFVRARWNGVLSKAVLLHMTR